MFTDQPPTKSFWVSTTDFFRKIQNSPPVRKSGPNNFFSVTPKKQETSKTDAASIKTAIKNGMVPKVTVAQLREVCEYYGIKPVGKKADLFQLIKNH